VQVTGLTGVVDVSAGYSHSVALMNNATVRAWGRNDNGQLGDGTTTQSTAPVQVTGLTGVTAISAGHYHNVVLKNDGKLMAWGYNSYGNLGDGTTATSTTPVQVTGLTGVTYISAGAQHNTAIKSDNSVWAWGSNATGQLGVAGITKSAVPVLCIDSGPAQTYTVTFSVTGGNGSLTAAVDGANISSGASVQQGKSVVFTAAPNSGRQVKEWKLNGTVVSGNKTNSYTLANLTSAATVTVEYELIPEAGQVRQYRYRQAVTIRLY